MVFFRLFYFFQLAEKTNIWNCVDIFSSNWYKASDTWVWIHLIVYIVAQVELRMNKSWEQMDKSWWYEFVVIKRLVESKHLCNNIFHRWPAWLFQTKEKKNENHRASETHSHKLLPLGFAHNSSSQALYEWAFLPSHSLSHSRWHVKTFVSLNTKLSTPCPVQKPKNTTLQLVSPIE